MKRLSVGAPDLDIFGSGYVLRDDKGWLLTAAGHAFLAGIESPPSATLDQQMAKFEVIVTSVPARQSPAPPLRLVADNRRRIRRRAHAKDQHQPVRVA
jgi:hypothetical protein